jgi:hypothetical protein
LGLEEIQRRTLIFHNVDISFSALRQMSPRLVCEHGHSSQYWQRSGCGLRAVHWWSNQWYRPQYYLRDRATLCVDEISCLLYVRWVWLWDLSFSIVVHLSRKNYWNSWDWKWIIHFNMTALHSTKAVIHYQIRANSLIIEKCVPKEHRAGRSFIH